ncbi:hypothetical protein WAF17_05645 [Bernardetia sp. ABR2-2B]|uniref:hypothetical protein n=1 Tax=Bernardetia sp. ABR2-2B TaxID=3127472 RepID=UPI0030CF9F34
MSFSTSSCQGVDDIEPLEIQIENKTGYDLTDIRIDNIKISSLENEKNSGYISTESFGYMNIIYAKTNIKFEQSLYSISFVPRCGNDSYYDEKYKNHILTAGKHSFVLSLYEMDGKEYLSFDKK